MTSKDARWDKRQKHLEMIQRIVDRMSTTSFLLKGWMVALVSALLALATRDAGNTPVYLCYLPTLAFWGLDGYYLRQERLFRRLYEKVCALPEDDVDFSMKTSGVANGTKSWFKTCQSGTLVAFYGMVSVVILLVTALMRWSK